MRTARMVVGTDGSPPSLTALRWAALEAQRRCVELAVVLAYNWRTLAARLLAGSEFKEYIRDLATAVVDAAVAEVRTIAPRVRVHGDAVFGEPAPVLLDASDGADMVVVGSHDGDGPDVPRNGSDVGRVSVQVAARTDCPATVVVRGDEGRSTAPVVVGVDDSASAEFATGVAVEEAARRRCPLMAVRAYEPTRPPRRPDGRVRTPAALETALLGQLAGWHDKYPEVSVEHTIARGSPAAVLTAWSRYAQLVVVGGGPAHRPARRLPVDPVDSVGRELIRHADCPVLIARARAGL